MLISIGLFLSLTNWGCGNKDATLNNLGLSEDNSEIIFNGNGAEDLIKSFLKSGIFQIPSFSFTNKYDQYKQYPNLKGLFINGLNYHGKATKVFCWYGIPESLQKGEKAPAVVLVHGGGGTVYPEWIKNGRAMAT